MLLFGAAAAIAAAAIYLFAEPIPANLSANVIDELVFKFEAP